MKLPSLQVETGGWNLSSRVFPCALYWVCHHGTPSSTGSSFISVIRMRPRTMPFFQQQNCHVQLLLLTYSSYQLVSPGTLRLQLKKK